MRLYCTSIITIFLITLSGHLVAADCIDPTIDQTVEYCDDTQEDTIKEPERISAHELSEHLLNPKTARYQIKQNLALSTLHCDVPHEWLQDPVLVVGTGTNQALLTLKHTRPTFISSSDVSVDRNPDFRPHYQVDDAFLLNGPFTALALESFRFVFFAHVGNRFLPMDYLSQLTHSLKIYYELLINDGIFIYNSEVHRHKNSTISEMVTMYKKESFDTLKSDIVTLFNDAGFIDVDVILKDEPPIFCDDAISFLVIAKKPPSAGPQ